VSLQGCYDLGAMAGRGLCPNTSRVNRNSDAQLLSQFNSTRCSRECFSLLLRLSYNRREQPFIWTFTPVRSLTFFPWLLRCAVLAFTLFQFFSPRMTVRVIPRCTA